MKAFAEQVRKEGRALPAAIEKLLASGRSAFYESAKGARRSLTSRVAQRERWNRRAACCFSIAERCEREVERNSGASLIDLGDGVVCCEFHAK